MEQIQSLPNWKIHTPNDGSNIGGIQPTNYGWLSGHPLGPTEACLFVEGTSWATVESYYLAPLPAGNQFSLSFDLIADEVSLANLMCIETDIIYCAQTTRSNMSMQRRHDLGDMVQVAGQDGSWVDTGFQMPLLAGAPIRTKISYAIGTTTFGVQAVQQDSILLELVRPDLQQLTPIKSNWIPGALIQLQMTIKELPAGTASAKASLIFDNMTIV